MAATATVPPNINFYWDEVKNLSNEVKLELITRLSNSLMLSIQTKPKANTLDRCFGTWKLDDASTSELLRDIKDVCSEKKDFIAELL